MSRSSTSGACFYSLNSLRVCINFYSATSSYKSKCSMDAKTLERFEAKYIPEPNTGCWLWIGQISRGGYGRFKINPHPIDAHRVSWELANGPIPEDLFVCHRCDVRSCVNPDHLFLGTHQDNMADRDAKGRGNVGERNPRAVLTKEQVSDIRAAYRSGVTTQRSLAKAYGVSSNHVCEIVTGKSWRSA